MKITLLEVRKFKAVKDITIEPGERSMVLIAGKNRQGKTSLMDAMTAALGGTRALPDTPVHTGAKAADIRIEFDGGDLVVHRKITAKGKSTLVVTRDGAKIGKPQKVLDDLVGKRFLDPLAFMRLKPREQRDKLVSCVDLSIDLFDHSTERKQLYDERSGFNADIKSTRVKLEAKEDSSPIPDEIDVSVVIDELRKLRDVETTQAFDLRKHASIVEAIKSRRDFITDREAEIESLKAAIRDTERGIESEERGLHAAELDLGTHISDEDLAHQVADAEDAINGAADANAARKVIIADREEYSALAGELKLAERSARDLTHKIGAMDEAKETALAAAVMPVDGLGFDEDGCTYRGVPLSQASGAEQLQVSLGLAAAMSADLRDICITDGALLDEDSLIAVGEYAAEHDIRVWLERVGTGDDGAIIISAGEVVDAESGAS